MDSTEARRRLVSDHAIVRYIERVLGTPELIESIVNHLLDEDRAAMVLLTPNGDIRIGKTDTVLRVRYGKVVSVLNNQMRAGHRPIHNKARRKP
jgi:hypothetical protein